MFVKGDITTNVLDVFSPVKRKESDTENSVEAKQKRPRDATLIVEKKSPKRFSTVIDADGKKVKPDQSKNRETIRSKELEMDLEAAKALTSKGMFPGSTKSDDSQISPPWVGKLLHFPSGNFDKGQSPSRKATSQES
jgi:hypothetical protein